MKDLGLAQLSDDQIMELLIELCGELSNRDPIVRNMAQKEIYTEAKQLKDKRQAMKDAIQGMRKNYVKLLKEEIGQAINEQIRRGEIRVLTDEEEFTIRTTLRMKHLKSAQERERAKLNEQITADLRRQILMGTLDPYTPEEKQRFISEATSTALDWLKRQGTMSLDAFALGRNSIFEKLKDMGHNEADILKLYGKP
jgi:hypothetical protein